MSTLDTPPRATGDFPFTQRRDFWILLAYAAVLGIVGGVFSLLFIGMLGVANNWYDFSSSGWMGGHWWWVAVTAAAGVLVGPLRRLTHLPDKTPGLIADVRDEYVDPKDGQVK